MAEKSRCSHPELDVVEGDRIRCRVCEQLDVPIDPRMRQLLLEIESLKRQIQHVRALLNKR
jgi:hypothetical protein